MPKQRIVKIVGLFFVLFLSLVIRLALLQKGLPLYPHPDEKDFIVRTLNMVRRVDFDPGWYGLPGSTFMYLLYPFYLVIYLLGVPILDVLKTFDIAQYKILLETTWNSFVPNVWDTYIIARGFNTVLALGTIVLTFVLAKRLFKRFSIALAAAAFLGLAPLFVDYSALARADTVTMFFILLGMTVFYDAVTTQSKRKLILASLLIGIATWARFHAIVAAIPVGLYALYQDSKTYSLKNVVLFVKDSFFLRTNTALAILFVLLGFYFAAPFTILNWKVALFNIKFEARTIQPGQETLPGLQNWLWYVPNVLINGIGHVGLFFLFIIGALTAVREQRKQKDLPLLFSFIFPLLFYPFIALANLRWDRWMLPLLPYEAILAAYGLFAICHWIARSLPLPKKHLPMQLFFGLALLALIPTSYTHYARAVAQYNNNNDNNVIQWITQEVHADDTIIVEGLPHTALAAYAEEHHIPFVDISTSRITDLSQYRTATYAIVVKDASTALFCYPIPAAGSTEKGDLLCDKEQLRDTNITNELSKTHYATATIQQEGAQGLSVVVYRKK